jgi:hypothetical protein
LVLCLKPECSDLTLYCRAIPFVHSKTSIIYNPHSPDSYFSFLKMGKLTLSNAKIRKDSTYAFAASGGVIKGGVKKTPLSSPTTKSLTRSSLRLQKEDPEASPLHDTWESFGSKPAEYTKELFTDRTPEVVVLHKEFKKNKHTGESKLWGIAAERSSAHFYPGQIVRVLDPRPQTWWFTPMYEPFNMATKEGPVFAKRRPFVILWKTDRKILCLPLRSLDKSLPNHVKNPKRWREFISVTTAADTEWKDNTSFAGPPLTCVSTKASDILPHKRCYIQLTRPVSFMMGTDMHMNCGRLNGDDYCRLIEAYMFVQNKHKQQAFAEYGELGNLQDGVYWREGEKSSLCKSRELRTKEKQPEVVDKETTTYRLG